MGDRPGAYGPLRDAATTASKLLSSLPSFIPHRIRRKFRSTRSKIRSRASPTSSITALETSLSPADTIAALRAHQWSFWDAQYLFLAVLLIFAMCISEQAGPLVKTLLATGLMGTLVVPLTRQFFLPFLPILTWLLFLFSCHYLQGAYRPPIWVKVLPALENILYGANLSNILSSHKSTFLDVLAWIPYGLTHFGGPPVCSAIMFVFGPPGTVPAFARAFGYMNIIGVIIQLTFPCSPPWYENLYGLAPANYSMQGSPAGLAAIDKLLGIDLYTSSFTASPMVFGAFPSLHAGTATIEAFFMTHTFPKLKPLFILYTLWLCWATMYLSHHYAVDLVAGSLLATLCYFFTASKFLPSLQPGKMFRWDYDFVEIGDSSSGFSYGGLADGDEDDFRHGVGGGDGTAEDMWSLGTSSSVNSSASRSPIGMRSPVDDEGWEGETLAGGSDGERGKR